MGMYMLSHFVATLYSFTFHLFLTSIAINKCVTTNTYVTFELKTAILGSSHIHLPPLHLCH